MPWRNTTIMDEKYFFINEYLAHRHTITETCKQFGISRTLGYKYIDRYNLSGFKGLEELSRKPKTSPTKTPNKVARDIISLRNKHPRYGADKIKTILEREKPDIKWPSQTTIHTILKSEGLIPDKKTNRHIYPCNPKFDPEDINDIWSIDYKGKMRLINAIYSYPLTITDSFSRFLLAADALANPTTEATKAVLIRVFDDFGLPTFIHSDNGVPFAGATSLARLSSLSVWFIELGITPVYSDPAKPGQNGRHERMHKELKAETASPLPKSHSELQRRLNAFITEYNDYRPHNSLNNKTPASIYKRSERVYTKRIEPWDYPGTFEVKRVLKNGAIRWGNDNWVMVATPLIGKDIGLEEISDGLFRVYFRFKLLGYLDVKKLRIQDIQGRFKRQ
jgi:transposase InsO family protein